MNAAPTAVTKSSIEVEDQRSAAPDVRETHTGVVVLVGDRAYKAKKPVVTDFLDFSTPERREAACAREVELNSRIAPDSYIGVSHLSDPTGGPPEPVIVMRRYADALRLASLVKRGESVEHHVAAIAEAVARFHQRATRSRAIDWSGNVAAIRARWTENLDELRLQPPTASATEDIDEVRRLANQFIDGRAALFAQRVNGRRIVDGHGDLLADDIFCLPDGPVLLDCLEFDDDLRYVDCIDDIAFLAMDLDYLGRRDLSDHLVQTYLRLTDDPAPMSLQHFYIAYRAVVRAKVDCIRAGQGDAAALGNARRHLDVAREYLRTGAVRLILVGGGPGTGKSTLARALGKRLQADVLSTDDVRRELSQTGEIDGTRGDYNTGLYKPDNVGAVYTTMLQRASLLLASGHTVILDGTWRDVDHRQLARETARRGCCPMVELACTVSLEQAQARILERRGTTSDATPEIATAIAGDMHNWGGAHLIHTNGPLGDSVAEAHQICCLAT